VVTFCSHDPAGGVELADAVTRRGPGRAQFGLCDVSKADDLARFIETTARAHGRLDCLVNNAGWHPPHHPIDVFTPDDFRQLFELNVMSVFVGCRTALPWLRQTRGCIINIASLVATIGQHHATTYVA